MCSDVAFEHGEYYVEAPVLSVDLGAKLALACAVLATIREDAILKAFSAIAVTDRLGIHDWTPSSGFDDVLIRPFSNLELNVRVRFVAHRASRHKPTNERRALGLSLDLAAHDVWFEGRRIDVTAREFALLKRLWLRRGKVVTRADLYRQIWGGDTLPGSRALDSHLCRLRAKLPLGCALDAVRGYGYKLSCSM